MRILRDGSFVFALGFALGLLSCSIATTLFDEHKLLIKECERELPRNQHCVLAAIHESASD